MDLATILKAIALVGDLTPAAMALYEGFIADTHGADQAELQRRYQVAREEADAVNAEMERRFPIA